MKTRFKLPLLLTAGIGGTVAATSFLRKSRYLPLHGKVVLVTGGSRGLGLLLAKEFAGEGARVAICARDGEELDRARRQLQRESGLEVQTFVCDVTDKAQVEKTIEDVQQQLGPIDVLVNNAGIMELGPLETMTLQDFEDEMNTHFWAQVYTTMTLVPVMKARGGGRIVNITSIGGKISIPHMVPYSAAKFAATGLSQGMRIELAKDNILVTTVCPLIMRLGSFYNADMKGQHRKEFTLGNLLNANPLTSMSGERCARQVVQACKHGDAVLIPSRREKLAISFASLFPNFSYETLGFMTRFMPGPDGPESIGTAKVKGKESTTPLSPSPLTTLNDQAALRNNELNDPASSVDAEVTEKVLL
jgi:NAD(P)-dependent dehydrogenase (short-subunit alcohol dehydrogenase family)